MQNWYSFNLNVMVTYVNVQSSFICLSEDKKPKCGSDFTQTYCGFYFIVCFWVYYFNQRMT